MLKSLFGTPIFLPSIHFNNLPTLGSGDLFKLTFISLLYYAGLWLMSDGLAWNSNQHHAHSGLCMVEMNLTGWCLWSKEDGASGRKCRSAVYAKIYAGIYIYIYICSSSKICNWIMCTHFSGIWHNNHLKIAEMVSYITNWFSVPWHSDISYKWSLYILPAVFNWDSIYMSLHMKAMRLPKKIKMSWFMILWKYSYSVIYISFPCVVSS